MQTRNPNHPFKDDWDFLVRLKGLEPPRLSAPDPKSGAATNYATTACCFRGCKDTFFFRFLQRLAQLFK